MSRIRYFLAVGLFFIICHVRAIIDYNQVVITKPTNGMNLCPEGDWVELDDIVIYERDVTSFGEPTGSDFIQIEILASDGFEFDDSNTPTISYSGSGTFSKYDPELYRDSKSIRFNIFLSGSKGSLDVYTISNVRVKNVDGSITSGFIYRGDGGQDDAENVIEIGGLDNSKNASNSIADLGVNSINPIVYSDKTDNKVCLGESINFTATSYPNAFYTFHRREYNSVTNSYGVETEVRESLQNDNTLEVSAYQGGWNNQDRVVVYVTTSGCTFRTNELTVSRVDVAQPSVFSGLKGIYGDGEDRVLLNDKITPTGGEFTGNGVIQDGANYYFAPSAFKDNPGTTKIKYTVSNGECSNSRESDDIIIGESVAFLENATDGEDANNLSYCLNTVSPKLRAKPETNLYRVSSIVSSKPGVITSTSAEGVNRIANLNLSGLSSGEVVEVTVNFVSSVFNPSVFPYSEKGTFSVLSSNSVISGLNYYECQNSEDTVKFTGIPTGGTYSYTFDGTTGTQMGDFDLTEDDEQMFIPKQLVPGSYTINYNTDGITQCGGVTSYTTRLRQSPDLNMEVKNLSTGNDTLFCDGDSVLIRDLSPWRGGRYGRKRYSYDFGDGIATSFTYNDSVQSRLYTQPNEYIIEVTSYSAVPDFISTCPSTFLDTILVGAQPVSDFGVEGVVENVTSSYMDASYLVDSSFIDQDVVVNWEWSFGDLNLSTDQNPTHTYLNTGIYDVKLKTIGWSGCSDSITKKIPIFPEYIIDESTSKTFTFLNQFNSEGWYSTSDYEAGENSSWRITRLSGDTIKETGDNRAWMTSNTILPVGKGRFKHNINENSWVLSPVFDVSAMEKPMISMLYWVAAESRVDGAAMQYTFSDTTFGNEVWHTLGDFTEAGNWYNTEILTSNPGNSDDAIIKGWTGITEDWSLGRTAIDAAVDSAKLYNNGKIQFRIAFASNGDPPGDFDGFAFDDFFIGERTRQVLIENFTTTVSNTVSDRDDGISEAVGKSNDEAILINYHLQADYPNSNYFFGYNPADLGSRGLYYGIGFNNANNNMVQLENAAPRSFVDGIFYEDRPFIEDDWGEEAYNLRILDPTAFEITSPTVVNNGNSLSISTSVLRKEEVAGQGPFAVYVVVLKDSAQNRPNTAEEDEFYDNVVVQILPSAAGMWFSENDWAAGESKPVNVEWELYESVEDKESYQVLAFIQDVASREVYQTSSLVDIDELDLPNTQPSIYGADQLAKFSAALEIDVYETGGYTTPVHLSFAPGEGKQWMLYDITGQIVSNGLLRKNQQTVNIDNNLLSSGIYLFKVEGHEAVGKIRVLK